MCKAAPHGALSTSTVCSLGSAHQHLTQHSTGSPQGLGTQGTMGHAESMLLCQLDCPPRRTEPKVKGVAQVLDKSRTVLTLGCKRA